MSTFIVNFRHDIQVSRKTQNKNLFCYCYHRRTQNPVKHLRWSVLQKQLTASQKMWNKKMLLLWLKIFDFCCSKRWEIVNHSVINHNCKSIKCHGISTFYKKYLVKFCHNEEKLLAKPHKMLEKHYIKRIYFETL